MPLCDDRATATERNSTRSTFVSDQCHPWPSKQNNCHLENNFKKFEKFEVLRSCKMHKDSSLSNWQQSISFTFLGCRPTDYFQTCDSWNATSFTWHIKSLLSTGVLLLDRVHKVQRSCWRYCGHFFSYCWWFKGATHSLWRIVAICVRLSDVRDVLRIFLSLSRCLQHWNTLFDIWNCKNL